MNQELRECTRLNDILHLVRKRNPNYTEAQIKELVTSYFMQIRSAVANFEDIELEIKHLGHFKIFGMFFKKNYLQMQNSINRTERLLLTNPDLRSKATLELRKQEMIQYFKIYQKISDLVKNGKSKVIQDNTRKRKRLSTRMDKKDIQETTS